MGQNLQTGTTNLSHFGNEFHTSENQIIRSSIKILDYKRCQVSPFKIELLVYITLTNNQGYMLIPEKELLLNINCLKENRAVVILEPTLIRTNEDCVLNSDSTIIKLRKSEKFAKPTSYKKNITIPFSAGELNLLQVRLLPLQKHIKSDKLAESSKTLDEVESSLDKIKSERRTVCRMGKLGFKMIQSLRFSYDLTFFFKLKLIKF